MPLVFNIDKDLPKEVSVITLAYTLFDVSDRVH
jgi:cytochrome c oxidase assembly protein Cox11